MNMCLLLGIATIVLTTAAQDTNINSLSAEPNSDNFSLNTSDIADIFEEDEAIDYSALLTTPAQVIESYISTTTIELDPKDPVTSRSTIDSRRTTPEISVQMDDSMINEIKETDNFPLNAADIADVFDEDEFIDYSALLTTPAQDTDSSISTTTIEPDPKDPVTSRSTIDPRRTDNFSLNAADIADVFDEDEVIDYSALLTTPAQVIDSSISTTTVEPDPKDPVTSRSTIDPRRTTPEVTIQMDESIISIEPDDPYENEVDSGPFKEDEVIYYSTLLTKPAQDKDSSSSTTTLVPDQKDPVTSRSTIDPRRTTPEISILVDESIFSIETDDPSENEVNTEEDEVNNKSDVQGVEVQNSTSASTSTTYSNFTIPESNLSVNIDFADWDLMNGNETTLFEEFNQTILTEIMKQRKNGSSTTNDVEGSTSETLITPAPPRATTYVPSRHTTPLITQTLDDSLFDFVESEETDTKATTTSPPSSSTTAAPSRKTTPLITLTLDESLFDFESEEAVITKATTTRPPSSTTTAAPPSSTTAPSRKTTPPKIYKLNMDNYKPEKVTTPHTEPDPSPTGEPDRTESTTLGFTVTTQPPDSEEIGGGSDEYLDPSKVTEEPDYDLEEAQKDPCNYEKFPHSIPEIEKAGRRVSEIKCEEYMWNYTIHVLDVIRNRKECAEQMARRNEIATTIVGGAKARQGDFTHMGAVGWIHSDGSYRWMCGSSLISPRFTITAAHCRNASSKLKLRYTEPRVVRFGSVFLESKDNVTNSLLARDVLIAEFLVLEEYARQPIKKYNDIGLIRLQEEVHATIYIKPACLWTGFLGNDWVANITGWGKTTNTEGSESNHLRYAEVDFVEQSTCKRYIHGRRNRHWSEGLKDHQFCAGKLQGGIDACQGDSGGPLSFREPMPAAMNTIDVVHRVVGITNFGIKCAYPLLPGVYTNVTSFICWIEKNVWPEENNEFCP